jgi:hypothetical protein
MSARTADLKTNFPSSQIQINQPEITQMKLFLVVPLDDGHELRGVVVVSPVKQVVGPLPCAVAIHIFMPAC